MYFIFKYFLIAQLSWKFKFYVDFLKGHFFINKKANANENIFRKSSKNKKNINLNVTYSFKLIK